jgi:hypothetical protein
MAVGDIYKLAFVYRLHGQTMVNTSHYLVTQDPSTGLAEVILADRFRLVVANAIATIQSSQVFNERVECQRVGPGARLLRYDLTLLGNGPQTTPPVPEAVAMVFRRRTQYAGRKYRGRIFVGGVAQAFFDTFSGRWFPGVESNTGAILLALKSTLTDPGSGMTAVPVLYKNNSTATQQILSTVMDPIPRSQRRRQLGVGV